MNRIFRIGVAGLCLAGAAIAVYASETITYTYDARGGCAAMRSKP